VIMLPLAKKDSTNKKVGYLLEELHTSIRWPILVFNVTDEMKGNMYIEMHQHGDTATHNIYLTDFVYYEQRSLVLQFQ
jgi:hypothetical protein